MNKNKLIDKLFLIVVSLQTILMGILFIVQVLRIYFGNNQEFTRDICVLYINQILPVIILWIVLVIASYIYFYTKKNPNKEISKTTNIAKLQLLENRIDTDNSQLKIEYKKRKYAKIVNIVIVVICSIMGLCYLLNTKHFASTGDLSAQAIQMSIHLSPWVIISFVSLIGCTLYEEISAKRSIDLIKEIMKNNGKSSTKRLQKTKEDKIILVLRTVFLVIAVALIIVGAIDGGAEDVLQKAINICTECIGLG